MKAHEPPSIAVIFAGLRTGDHEAEYADAAAEMSKLVAEQPGFLGERHARDDAGYGITVSYWIDEASAKAWRDHPEHARIRDAGRDRWYSRYTLEVARIERSYDWQK